MKVSTKEREQTRIEIARLMSYFDYGSQKIREHTRQKIDSIGGLAMPYGKKHKSKRPPKPKKY